MLWVGSAPHRPGDALGSGMRSVRAGCGAGAMRAALKPHAPFAPRYRSYSSSSSSRRHRPAPPPVNTAAPVLSMGGAAPPGPLGAGRGGISPAANGRPPERGCWRERHRGAPRYPHRAGGGHSTPQRPPGASIAVPTVPPTASSTGIPPPSRVPQPPPVPHRPVGSLGLEMPSETSNRSAPHLGATPPPFSSNPGGGGGGGGGVPPRELPLLPADGSPARGTAPRHEAAIGPPGCRRCRSERCGAPSRPELRNPTTRGVASPPWSHSSIARTAPSPRG